MGMAPGRPAVPPPPGVVPAVPPAPPKSRATDRADRISGDGTPLPNSLRAFFEPRFGMDFGRVRLHTDETSATEADALRAKRRPARERLRDGRDQARAGRSHELFR